MIRAVVAGVACVALCAPAATAHIGNHSVRVEANSFTPRELPIDPGETVTWNVLQDGHTITADDGAFDFRGAGGGTIPAGESRQWTAPAADVSVPYHCAVHVGMIGEIIVGNPPPPPPDPEEPIEVRRVPADHPTLESALTAMPPRVRIELAPGTYATKGVTVLPPAGAGSATNPTVQIVGTGSAAGDVVIEAAPGARGTGLGVAASDVVVEGLTVRGFATAIVLDRVADVAVVDVVADGSRYGIRAIGTTNLQLSGVRATGSSMAAIAIERCGVCDALVSDAVAAGSTAGILLTGAGSVVVVGSHVHDNGVGVAVLSDPGLASPARGVHIVGNLIEGNDRVAPATDRLRNVRAGVWIDGGVGVVMEDNDLREQRFGLLATALGGPVLDGRISGNSLQDHDDAALAWDGIGAGLCFADNAGAVTSQPAAIETLYPCDRATVGIPYPLVTAAALG